MKGPFVVMIALVVLVGCGRAVSVSPPDPGDPMCERIIVPTELVGERQLSVEPDDPGVAAWGSPPIIWRCGVRLPTSYEPTSPVIEIDGVAWFPEQLESGSRFTSIEGPHQQVTIPGAYTDVGAILQEFSQRQPKSPQASTSS